jgi:hypothetical protein
MVFFSSERQIQYNNPHPGLSKIDIEIGMTLSSKQSIFRTGAGNFSGPEEF